MYCPRKYGRPSAVPAAYIFAAVFFVLGQCSKTVYGKPIEDTLYRDTEEFTEEILGDDSYESDEAIDSAEPESPKFTYLPPVLVEYSTTTLPPSSTTTSKSPIYFPKTDIEMSPFIDQLNKARRQEIAGPVDLPVPYIVWTKDPSGNDDRFNYWQRFYSTMYKVD